MDYIYHYDSPLGGITSASDGEALTGLWFDGQKYFGSTLSVKSDPQRPRNLNLPVFEQTGRWLCAYFSGREPGFTPPLSLKGTPFYRSVWEILLTIPFGQTITYKEIAAKIARQRSLPSMSAQAVGGAVGHNPISLIIPCHRVIGSKGSLTGYAGGIARKEKLLMMEKISFPSISSSIITDQPPIITPISL